MQKIKRIDESLEPLRDALERAELTIRRLDGLPEVPPEATAEQVATVPTPDSVDQVIASVQS